MWRLRGIEIAVSGGPLHNGFIELGDVTVLVGPNDSGKTRVLKCIESALQNPDESDGVLDLFGVAETAAVEAFLDRGEADEEDIYTETEPVEPFRAELAVPMPEGEVLFGIRPISLVKVLPAWSYGRSLAELPDNLRARVEAAFDGVQMDPRIPLKLEFLGGVDPSIMPVVVAVPSPPEQLEAEVGVAVVNLCRALRLANVYWGAVEDRFGELDGVPDRDWQPPATIEASPVGHSPRWLLDESPDASVHHPAALFACEALVRLATELLPDFIGRDYELSVVPAAPTDIARGATIDIGLAPAGNHQAAESADEPDDDADQRFALRDTASGFTVWLQLALLEAIARVQILTQVLDDGLDRARVLGMRSMFSERQDDPEQLIEIKDAIERVFASLADPVTVPPGSVTDGFELLPRWQVPAADQPPDVLPRAWLSVSALRPRLYLLDEPEQRLHPALQRRAASWLAELMDTWGSQCILATHSTAFIDMPGDPKVWALVRQGKAAALQPFDLQEFSPHAQLAREMGFDRGELLSHWRAFLFVEGRTDLGVIEELFGDELRSARICLQPVFGHRHHAGLLDMAMFALGMATPIAALFDTITEDEIQRVRRSTAQERVALRAERGEIGTVATIVDLELPRDRQEIEILTIGARDIFDLLDEDAIRQVLSGRRGTPFPGHESARMDFAREGGGNAADYKKFLRREYGIVMSERVMRDIARRMTANGTRPPELSELLMRVERLALAFESRR